MPNKHQEKFITKMLLGFSFITIGVLLIFYAAFTRTRHEDWYFWGIVASIILNTGLYLLVTAFVHKIKSDFIKRQKQREAQRTVRTNTSS